MHQTRLMSLTETVINTAVGFVVSMAGWPLAASVFSISYTGGQHVGVVAFFTFLSVLRGYLIRRFFNGHVKRVAALIAARIEKRRA